MNRLVCKVEHIESQGSVNLVDLRFGDHLFSAIIMEEKSEQPWLSAGGSVQVLFKETEVSLAVGDPGRLSLRNRMPGPVVSLTKGTILSRLEIDFQGNRIVSVVTTRSVENLGIQIGTGVVALVKATELMLIKEAGVS